MVFEKYHFFLQTKKYANIKIHNGKMENYKKILTFLQFLCQPVQSVINSFWINHLCPTILSTSISLSIYLTLAVATSALLAKINTGMFFKSSSCSKFCNISFAKENLSLSELSNTSIKALHSGHNVKSNLNWYCPPKSKTLNLMFSYSTDCQLLEHLDL